MWQLSLCVGIIFLLLEIFIPGLFFLNLAISAFICAVVAFFVPNITVLILTFCILSVILIFTLRPLLIKISNGKKQQTGIEEKYIGKTAVAVENISKNSGAISIYDERWQARNIDDSTIEKGSQVEIVGNESIVMKVKKVN